MKTIFVALGSNLGDRASNLQDAIARLEKGGLRVSARSAVYETEPMYVAAQPAFLNQVIQAETSLFPRQVLRTLQAIERAMGRVRKAANGPRIIDLDVLFYASAVIRLPELKIPHPRLQERRFVLEPLAEIAPNLRHPVLRKTIRELLAGVERQGVRRAPDSR